MCGKESVSISVNSEFKIDSQNGRTADANPVETQVQMTVFRPHSKESVSVSNKIADAV
ncbi:hypothetical protein Tco_1234339, partial [Tanacetum coccineum]